MPYPNRSDSPSAVEWSRGCARWGTSDVSAVLEPVQRVPPWLMLAATVGNWCSTW